VNKTLSDLHTPRCFVLRFWEVVNSTTGKKVPPAHAKQVFGRLIRLRSRSRFCTPQKYLCMGPGHSQNLGNGLWVESVLIVSRTVSHCTGSCRRTYVEYTLGMSVCQQGRNSENCSRPVGSLQVKVGSMTCLVEATSIGVCERVNNKCES
jgi:hypothetical protein